MSETGIQILLRILDQWPQSTLGIIFVFLLLQIYTMFLTKIWHGDLVSLDDTQSSLEGIKREKEVKYLFINTYA
jgi:hypothetical protein